MLARNYWQCAYAPTSAWYQLPYAVRWWVWNDCPGSSSWPWALIDMLFVRQSSQLSCPTHLPFAALYGESQYLEHVYHFHSNFPSFHPMLLFVLDDVLLSQPLAIAAIHLDFSQQQQHPCRLTRAGSPSPISGGSFVRNQLEIFTWVCIEYEVCRWKRHEREGIFLYHKTNGLETWRKANICGGWVLTCSHTMHMLT